jgi:hypothetical protein
VATADAPVRLRFGFGLLTVEGRLGPVMAQVARTLAGAVVSVFAVLHDAHFAITVIAALTVMYLTTVAAVALRAVRQADNPNRHVRHTHLQVLRALLGQSDPEPSPGGGDTNITINGGKTKINTR